jgi:cytoskeletal protein CcmA (bactofilin family)
MISSVASDKTPDREATKRFAPLLTTFFEANKTWFRELRTAVRPTRTPQGQLSFLQSEKEEGDMKGFKGNDEDSGQGRISRGVEVSGDVIFADALQVDGKVTGKLMSESGALMIEQTGDIQADVDVGVCVIRGALTGNVNARSRVEIYKTARVQGDISTPVLLVEEGAMLSGAITMGKAAARQPDAIRLDGNEELRKSQGASQ